MNPHILYPLRYSMTNLAKFIKAKRKEFGLTQVDLSQKSEVGRDDLITTIWKCAPKLVKSFGVQ